MKYSDRELKEFMLKEIEIIQNIIKRMAYNSFMIKGWTVTLVAVTLLLKGSKYQVFIAYIPLFVFWFLDAYFLWLERLYRRLYKWVIKCRLKTDEYLFDMDAQNEDRFEEFKEICNISTDDIKVDSKLKIMFSITLGLFYGSIFVLTLVYTIILLVVSKQNGG